MLPTLVLSWLLHCCLESEHSMRGVDSVQGFWFYVLDRKSLRPNESNWKHNKMPPWYQILQWCKISKVVDQDTPIAIRRRIFSLDPSLLRHILGCYFMFCCLTRSTRSGGFFAAGRSASSVPEDILVTSEGKAVCLRSSVVKNFIMMFMWK